MFRSNAEQPRRISVKEKEGKNTLLLPTPASHFGLQRFSAARGRVSAVFREMTCLCTNAALFCSEAACPGAVPLHFWLTLPSRACCSQEQCGHGWRQAGPGDANAIATWPPAGQPGLTQLAIASRMWQLWQKDQLQALLFGESTLRPSYKATVLKHHTAEARGQNRDLVGQDWPVQPLSTPGKDSLPSQPQVQARHPSSA